MSSGARPIQSPLPEQSLLARRTSIQMRNSIRRLTGSQWRRSPGHVSLLKYVRISNTENQPGSSVEDRLQTIHSWSCDAVQGTIAVIDPGADEGVDQCERHIRCEQTSHARNRRSWKKQTWQSLVTWFTMVSSESSRTPRLRTTDVDVRAGEMSVSRWTSRLPSCCFVPNQMYWVLSPFKRRRFEAIHSETLSIGSTDEVCQAAESSGELKP